jgi:peptide/nickel transport system permease protein
MPKKGSALLFRFVIRRLFLMVILLLGVSVMVFLISHLVPSNPVAANLSQTAMNDPEIVAAYEAKWGLDKPLYQQYFTYISNLLRGDSAPPYGQGGRCCRT